MGEIPAPSVPGGEYLVEVLFGAGPTNGEWPLTEADLEPWERRRGIRLEPWEAEIITEMSRTYMVAKHESRHFSAISPWPPGGNLWKYVQDQLHAKPKKQPVEGTPRNGSRQRH